MEKKAKRTYTSEEKAEAIALSQELGSGTAARYSKETLLKAEGGVLSMEIAPKKPRRPKAPESAASELDSEICDDFLLWNKVSYNKTKAVLSANTLTDVFNIDLYVDQKNIVELELQSKDKPIL